MLGNHKQDRCSRAVSSKPSDNGLGCPTRCLSVHTVPSEKFGQDSAFVRCMDESTGATSDSSERLCCSSSVGHKASCSRDGSKAYTSASASSRASTLSAMNEELILLEPTRRHAPSGRGCCEKIRRTVGSFESVKPTVVALEPATRREYLTRGVVDRRGPSDECPRCETGHGSHCEKCRWRLDKVRLQETELRQAEIPLTLATTTTTAGATTSASTSVPLTTASKPTLDAQTSATDVQATSDQSGGIKRPIEANSEMGTGVVKWIRTWRCWWSNNSQRWEAGGCSRMDLDCIASLPTYVLCPTTEEVEEYEEQEEDSGNEIDLVLERRVYDSKTGIEISREKGTGGSQNGNG